MRLGVVLLALAALLGGCGGDPTTELPTQPVVIDEIEITHGAR